MKKLFTIAILLTVAVLANYTSNGQAGVLNPADPDVIFTSAVTPATPPYGVISKWGHSSRLGWNPYSYGFKSYYFKGMAFRLKFPKSYAHNVADGKKYPALFFFHGLGEPGPITDNEYHLVHGGQFHAQKVDDGTFDGFLVYPQSASSSGYLQNYFPVIKDLVDSLVKYTKLDIDRINVGGLSSGGQATWDFPQQQQYAKLAAAIEPISAAQGEDVQYFASHITIPIFVGNGGQDVAPYPSTVTSVINSYKNLGGYIDQAYFEQEGHGAWNSYWNDPRYWPFLNKAHKANPLIYFQRDAYCPNESVTAKLGLQAGFAAYEWQKDGVTIPGATAKDLNVTAYGTYRGRFKRTSTSTWSEWSPIPAVISQKQATVTPPIQINGMFTNVLPAPDGRTTVPLFVPNTYASYEWRRVSDNALVSSANTFNAVPGQYKVKVTEQYGCSSDFSAPYVVIAANGTMTPDAASNLNTTAISNTTIQVEWDNNPTPLYNETGFEVYRSTTAGTGYKLIAKLGADVVSYSDAALSAATRYYYVIRAVNNNGASAVSGESAATTKSDILAPTAPTSLRVVSTTRTAVSLAWDESTDDVGIDKYDIYVNGSKSYTTSATSFTVNGLTPLQTYAFVVKARDVTGNVSPASNQVSGTAALQGLNYKYYEGNWSALPDFNTLVPVKTGKSSNVDISVRNRNDQFGFLWEGFINIPVTGSYTFETSSDDGSKLYIGSYDNAATPLVNNDGLHGTQAVSGTISLNAGVYPIAMTFFEQGGGEVMDVYWTSAAAGIARQQIPSSAFTDAVAIPASSLPVKPSALNVAASSYNRINLTWVDNSNNETGFEVVRSTELTGTYIPVGTAVANATGFVDTIGLVANTKYWYRLRAINQYGASDFVSKLEASWGFNGNLSDASGNNLTLTAGNAPTANTADKKEGTASMNLNGSNQYADMAFSSAGKFPSNAYTTRTVGMWIKPTASTVLLSNKIIIDLGGADNGLSLRLNSNSLQAGIASSTTGTTYRSTAAQASVSSNSSWVSNGWNHVAMVYNVNTLKLFINGVEKASTPLSFTSVGSSTSLSRIGQTNSGNAFNSSTSSTNYGGLIDDVDIITEPLTAAGIQALMKQSYPADTTFQLPAVPAVPAITSVVATSPVSITLNIKDNSTNETNFEIYRSAANTNSYRLLTTLNSNASASFTYVDNGLFANTNYYYKVRAIGVGGTSAFSAQATAKSLNNIPDVATIGNFTMRFDAQKTLQISATDADGEVLTFSTASALPSFATFTNGSNGAANIQLAPSFANIGSYPISVIVADGNGGKDTSSFVLTVNENYTPVATTVNNSSVAEGSNTNIALSATDQDGNASLAWALTTAPSFVLLTDNGNGSASLAITPGYAHAGVYPVTATVNDGAGGSEIVSFTLTVTDVVPPVEKIYMSVKYSSPNASAPWNNLATTNTTNLLNSEGQATNVGVQFLNTGWNGGNQGAMTGNNSGVYPDAVIRDYFFFGVYGAPETVNVNLNGLDVNGKYNVTLFGSSAWTGLGNNGTTVYTINGVAKPLYVDNNQQNTVTFTAVSPNASGIITVNMSKGANTPYGLVNAIVLEKPFDDGTAPVLPSNFKAQPLANGTVKLSWNDIAYNESGYNVTRSLNAAGPFTALVPGASANDSTYIDNAVTSSTTYYYRLEAVNSNGTSGLTAVASATTGNKAPAVTVITDVTAKGGATTLVNTVATDDAGDVLTTTVTGLPAFAVYQNIGNGTGRITFNPTVNDLGVYSGITVKVTDNAGASSSTTFNVTVTDSSVRSVYVNLGPAEATVQAAPWNNFLGYPFANFAYGNLKDDANLTTGFSYKFLDQWNGGLMVGMRTGNNTGVFPDAVMKSSYYNTTNGNHTIQFDGLNPDKRYSIGFLTNFHAGNAALVTFTSGSQVVTIDGKYNTSTLANLNGLVPNASGSIQVVINKPADNLYLTISGFVIREFNAATPVVRPADLFAETLLATDRIKLSWSDRSSNETGFQVWRATSANGTYSLVTTTAANVTTYTNTGLTANTRYYYKVRAINGGTNSAYSNVATNVLASNIVFMNLNVSAAQAVAAPWNNMSSASIAGAIFSNLVNNSNVNTGYEMQITKEFMGAGFAGATGTGIFPSNVMASNIWTDAGMTSQVKFTNLDISKKYRIGCFGSNLEVNYTTANYSSGGKTVELNSYYNTSEIVYLDRLTSTSNGEIYVDVKTAGGSPYSFTGAFTIEYFDDSLPEETVIVNTINQAAPVAGKGTMPENATTKKSTEATPASVAKTTVSLVETVNNIKVFPNPFTDRIQVDIENVKASTVTIVLFDLNGRMMFKSSAMSAMKGRNVLGASLPVGTQLAPGSYVVNILVDGKTTKSVKLIKVN